MTDHKVSDVARRNFLALKKRSYDIKFELSNTDYDPIENIGTGAYGVVCSAHHKQTKDKVAIKKIPNIFDHRKLAERTYREIKILKHFKHDNVICIRDILKPSEPLSGFKDVYIVLDLMESDLHRIIRSTQDLSDEHVRYFLYQILRGLKYIHSANVIHRDLKPSNLLVNQNCDLKIGDFGMARGISLNPSETSGVLMTQYVATRWYRAPEMMLNVEYTASIDVWSVACIFAELLDRKPLFAGKDTANQLNLIINKLGTPTEEVLSSTTFEPVKGLIKDLGFQSPTPLKVLFPKAARKALDLLGKMLQFHPSDRISVEKALMHPYLSKYHDPDDEPICVPAFNFDFEKKLNTMNASELKEAIVHEIMEFHQPKPKLNLSQFNIKPVSMDQAKLMQKIGIKGTVTKPVSSSANTIQGLLQTLGSAHSSIKRVDDAAPRDQVVPSGTSQVQPAEQCQNVSSWHVMNRRRNQADISGNKTTQLTDNSSMNNSNAINKSDSTTIAEPESQQLGENLMQYYLFKKPEPLSTRVKQGNTELKPGSAVSDVEMPSATSVETKPSDSVTTQSVDMLSASCKASEPTDSSVTMLSATVHVDESNNQQHEAPEKVAHQEEAQLRQGEDQSAENVAPPAGSKEHLKALLQKRKERLESGVEGTKPRVTAYQRQKEREDKRKKKLDKLAQKKKKDKNKGETSLLTQNDREMLARWADMAMGKSNKGPNTNKTPMIADSSSGKSVSSSGKMVSLLSNKIVESVSTSQPSRNPLTFSQRSNMDVGNTVTMLMPNAGNVLPVITQSTQLSSQVAVVGMASAVPSSGQTAINTSSILQGGNSMNTALLIQPTVTVPVVNPAVTQNALTVTHQTVSQNPTFSTTVAVHPPSLSTTHVAIGSQPPTRLSVPPFQPLPFTSYKDQQIPGQPAPTVGNIGNSNAYSMHDVSQNESITSVPTSVNSIPSYLQTFPGPSAAIITCDSGPWNANYDASRLPTYSEAVGQPVDHAGPANSVTNTVTGTSQPNELPFSTFSSSVDVLPRKPVKDGDGGGLSIQDVNIHNGDNDNSAMGSKDVGRPKITVTKEHLDIITLLTKQMSKSQMEDTPTLAMTPKGTGEAYGIGMDLSALLKESAAEQGANKPDSAPLSASLLSDWMEASGMDQKDLEALQQELIESPMSFSDFPSAS